MFNIIAVNPDHALRKAVVLLENHGVVTGSRNGKTIEMPRPTVTEWRRPQYRVMFNETRNANPFFHLFESLWILAGRRDVRFLEFFNKRMADFSDDGETFHAPYGYRIKDQLQKVIHHLKMYPDSRRAVLQIWDWKLDLGTGSMDIPCNDMVFLKIRDGLLNMTVCCRSNDMLWGAYGANVVQFSMIQEYIAAALGVDIGIYYQVSDSFHVYTSGAGGKLWDKVRNGDLDRKAYNVGREDDRPEWLPMVDRTRGETIDMFDRDLILMFESFDRIGSNEDLGQIIHQPVETRFFEQVVHPMLLAWLCWKTGMTRAGYLMLRDHALETDRGRPVDWIMAGAEWLDRKYKKELSTPKKGENYELDV